MYTKIVLYNHGGSGNHGCEALLRSITKLINTPEKIAVLSSHPEEDYKYGATGHIRESIIDKTDVNKYSVPFLIGYIKLKLFGDYALLDALPYIERLKEFDSTNLFISIGGDVYCYEDYKKYIIIHKYLAKKGIDSVLFGCSVTNELINNREFLKDMKKFKSIYARETLSYNLLKQAGLKNIKYIPDPAFLLEAEETDLPFDNTEYIGLNISTHLLSDRMNIEQLLGNIKIFVDWIINHTDFSIALIPHVVWSDTNDLVLLARFYNEFDDKSRIKLVSDQKAPKLKYIISKCKYFIGARTHSIIAAYSTCVPTITLGYSIKSLGIATDLLGAEENYVIQKENLKNPDTLIQEFKKLSTNEDEIKKILLLKVELIRSRLMGFNLEELYV